MSAISTRTRLRLSAAEISLILPTLNRIMAAEARTRSNEGLAPFRSLIQLLSPFALAGGRIRLDHLQLAASTFCARYTLKLVRHGHVQAWLPDHESATTQLIRKLEKHRMRARRRFERRFGPHQYVEERNAWPDVLFWLHTFALKCSCDRPKGWSNMRRWWKSVVDRACALATEGLEEHKCIPPTGRELRLTVRRALRGIRRGRAALGIRTLLEQPQLGRDYLARFVIRNFKGELKHFDFGTISAERAERLRTLVGSTY